MRHCRTGSRLMPLKKFERRRSGGPASSMPVEVRQELLEPDPDLELRQVRAEAEVRPAEAEGDVAVRRAADVEASAGRGNCRSSKLPEAYQTAPCRPSAIARRGSSVSRVAVRRKWCTGVSPAQDLVGRGRCSEGSASSRCALLGVLEQGDQARGDSVCRVVSLPAVVSSRKNSRARARSRRAPSTSASTSLVMMSSRGSARRASPSCGRRRTSRARPGSRTAGGVARRRRAPPRVGARHARGRCCRADGRRASIRSAAVLGRQRPSARRRPASGSPTATSAPSRTRSRAKALGEHLADEVADPLLVGVDDPRREALVDDRRAGACAPGRVRCRASTCAASTCSGVRVLQARCRRLRGVGRVVLRDGDDVVVAGERPEAGPSCSLCRWSGAEAAQQREPVVRHGLCPRVEVGEVDRGQVGPGARGRRGLPHPTRPLAARLQRRR